MPYANPESRRKCNREAMRRRRARLAEAGTPEIRVRVLSFEDDPRVVRRLDREVVNAWRNALAASA